MKLRDKPRINSMYAGPEIVIPIERGEAIYVSDVFPNIDDIDISKDIEIKMSVKRKKRSLDANAYMWQLCGEIARVIRSTKNEVYMQAIRDVGVSELHLVPDDAVDAMIKRWGRTGLGYMAEVAYKSSKNPGNTAMILWYGSSTYDTKEMSHLIDYIVDEAKGLGIETMTPDEIAKLKAAWGSDLTVERRKT